MAKENREYKDSVFCDLYYSDETAEKNLLELEVRVVNINTDKKYELLGKCGGA